MNHGAYFSTNFRLSSSVHNTHSQSGFALRQDMLHSSNLVGSVAFIQLWWKSFGIEVRSVACGRCKSSSASSRRASFGWGVNTFPDSVEKVGL